MKTPLLEPALESYRPFLDQWIDSSAMLPLNGKFDLLD